MDLGDDKLELAEGDVAAVDEGVPLDDVVFGEALNLAAVDGSLVCTQVEVVPQVEQVVRCCHRLIYQISQPQKLI